MTTASAVAPAQRRRRQAEIAETAPAEVEDLEIIEAGDDVGEAAPRPRGVKRPARTSVVIDGEELIAEDLVAEEMEEEDLAPGLPLIKNAKVVYIGARRNMSMALVGSVMTENIYSDDEVEADANGNAILDEHNNPKPLKTGELKTCIPDGIQSYDFSSHDNKGRPIKQHRMPVHPNLGEVSGRRYSIVEHPAHLMEFQRRLDANKVREFRVFVPKKYQPKYKEYVAEYDLRAGKQNRLLQKTTSNVE